MASLQERADEAAQRAKCTRCKCYILSMPSKAFIASGTVRKHGRGESAQFSLCGPCGFSLIGFLAGGGQ